VVAGYGVVLPVYQGKQGHPVGFGPQCRDALLALSGPQGASPVAREQKMLGRSLQMGLDDPGIVMDIDTVQDLARAEQLLGQG
jgi:molybdenum cofactor cytidylyltransferase